MEAIVAVGFAANLLQFVTYVHDIVSGAKEAYQSVSGSTKRNLELQSVAHTLQELGDKVIEAQRHAGDNGAPLNPRVCIIAADMKVISGDLLKALDELKVKPGSHRKWHTIRNALISTWKRPKTDALNTRLEKLRSELSIHIVSQMSTAQTDLLVDVRNTLGECRRIAASQVEKSDVIPLVGLLESLRIGSETDTRTLERQIVQLHNGAETAAGLRGSAAILKSLHYSDMDARFSSIAEAHSETFNWILEEAPSTLPEDDPRSTVRLANWLSEGTGIYWIAGKPGSGKSTLMKYLQGHAKTEQHLSRWAAGSRLTFARYYFWLAGSDMGKSQEGLLRRLLFEILQAHPAWIPTILPKRWEKIAAHRFMGTDSWLPDQGWTCSELLAAFGKLDQVVAGATSSTKICIFIDGLDEYYGDHLELIRTIQTVAKVKDIKLCVSSRPWNCFEDAFGKDDTRKLYLQHLTRDDIAKYARDMLWQLQKTYSRDQHTPDLVEELVDEIVSRAQGVFLWVFLVVRSLRDGIVNGDTLTLLQERLQEIPTDLEKFFEKIITSVDKVYWRRMAHTFQVALKCFNPLSLVLYSFIDDEQGRNPVPHGLPYEELSQVLATEEDRMSWVLNGRYKGLLETYGEPGFKYVTFLHRTVGDFLSTKDMQDLLTSYCEAGFSAAKQICQAFVAQETVYPGSLELSALEPDGEGDVAPENVSDEFLYFLLYARESGNGSIPFMERMESALYSRRPEYRGTVVVGDNGAITLFAGAIEFGFSEYVLYKLPRRPKMSETEGLAAMLCALRSFRDELDVMDDTGRIGCSAAIIVALLNHGVSARSRPGSRIPLQALVRPNQIAKIYLQEPEVRQHWLRVVIDLCKHGADVRDCLADRNSGHPPDNDHRLAYLVDLLLEWDYPRELLEDILPTVLGSPRPSSTSGPLSELITDDLWAKLLLHMYMYGPDWAKRGFDRRNLPVYADFAKLLLENGADPFRCTVSQALPEEMLAKVDKIQAGVEDMSEGSDDMSAEVENMSKGSEDMSRRIKLSLFYQNGSILVPEALRSIFNEQYPEQRTSVLAALDRATLRRTMPGEQTFDEARGLKRGHSEVEEPDGKGERTKRKLEEVGGGAEAC